MKTPTKKTKKKIEQKINRREKNVRLSGKYASIRVDFHYVVESPHMADIETNGEIGSSIDAFQLYN